MTEEKKMNQRLRRWALTYNCPNGMDEKIWLGDFKPAEVWDKNKNKIDYLVGQLERGESGRLHYQMYVEMKGASLMSTVKKLFGVEMHLSACKGNAQQNKEYCTKDDTAVKDADGGVAIRFEFGAISKQGERTDLQKAEDMILTGATIREVAMSHGTTYIKYFKGLERFKYQFEQRTERHYDDIKLWIWQGIPGCGKTSWAQEKWPNAYWANDHELAWMDGYDGEKVIVFDEFGGKFPLDKLLKLCQQGPVGLPIKGGHVNIVATTIVLLTNDSPKLWYNARGNWERRRKEMSEEKGLYFDCENPELRPEESEKYDQVYRRAAKAEAEAVAKRLQESMIVNDTDEEDEVIEPPMKKKCPDAPIKPKLVRSNAMIDLTDDLGATIARNIAIDYS